ncbi:ComEA family DNA-binding protein [Geodermatophilus ruber]|uniref:Competence protein ComEA n=1 Tax=Geodermatophilus ruber TaxID=504800 RepID=A0A1I4E970_9ACTN|nr:ComEA family DNA-binding protein [Geodermatophilus ruber]SFL00916.1 competence protein ComEA [Geodermatophilus ruber]
MRLSSRRGDDADLIRARLRALLDENGHAPGWVPEDETPGDLDTPGLEGRDGADPADALPRGIGRHRAPGAAVRLDPGRRGAWSLWAAGLLAALLLAAWTWWDRPRVEPAPAEPVGTSPSEAPEPAPATPPVGVAAETSPTVVVSVVGLVTRPGLVTLPQGSRVADAITAVGGLLPDADPAAVNLAAVLADGQQVAVGVPGAATAGASTPGAVAAGAAPVDLNAATVGDLDALPGIGPVLAQRIVDHREQHGRFGSVEQLDDVPGIGPATFAELVDLVTV